MKWRSAVDDYVDECLAARTPPRVTELAARLGVSAVRLTRELQSCVGRTASQCIKERQIAHAKTLLEGDAALEEIAAAAGFGTARTFFRSFSRRTGLTPGAYRRREKNVSGVPGRA